MRRESQQAGKSKSPSAASLTLAHLQSEPGVVFRAADIEGAAPGAASRALSRLVQEGKVQRLRKGLYYVPRETILGKSQPSDSAVLQKVLARKARPTGITAANLLGMSTQAPARAEFAAYTTAPPRGAESARLHLRPRRRAPELGMQDAALLEFIRQRGRYSELSAGETCARVKEILTGKNPTGDLAPELRWKDLRDAALEEPPRVRAILGALMQDAALPGELWVALRSSLNPLSRFEFGVFRELPNAKEWQAR